MDALYLLLILVISRRSLETLRIRRETGDELYAWLNDLVCVGEGKRVTEGVAYRVYAVINS